VELSVVDVTTSKFFSIENFENGFLVLDVCKIASSIDVQSYTTNNPESNL
jgi:hypothetical protein